MSLVTRATPSTPAVAEPELVGEDDTLKHVTVTSPLLGADGAEVYGRVLDLSGEMNFVVASTYPRSPCGNGVASATGAWPLMLKRDETR